MSAGTGALVGETGLSRTGCKPLTQFDTPRPMIVSVGLRSRANNPKHQHTADIVKMVAMLANFFVAARELLRLVGYGMRVALVMQMGAIDQVGDGSTGVGGEHGGDLLVNCCQKPDRDRRND